MTYDLSICIPTFNRLHCLEKCIESICLAKSESKLKVELCISDNNPEGNAENIINKFKNLIDINYVVNKENIGLGYNILKSSMMARGEFSWIIGNDDIILPNAFNRLNNHFKNHKNVDFYFINSYHLNSKFIFDHNHNHNFNINNIESFSSGKFSNYIEDKHLKFFDLVDKDIAFDFLLGMFLSVYRTRIWKENETLIDKTNIIDKNLYSNFDNTCPHIKIFGKAFCNSDCFFQSDPLSINLFGEREWSDIYPFIESFRIPQVLDYYRENGLKFSKYIKCKNFALRKLIINFLKIIFLKKYRGFKLINFRKDILYNLIYPYVYIGPLFYLLRKIIKSVNR